MTSPCSPSSDLPRSWAGAADPGAAHPLHPQWGRLPLDRPDEAAAGEKLRHPLSLSLHLLPLHVIKHWLLLLVPVAALPPLASCSCLAAVWLIAQQVLVCVWFWCLAVVVSPSGPLLHLRLQCDSLPQSLLRQADAPWPARPPAARLPQAQGQVRVLWQRVHRRSLRGEHRLQTCFYHFSLSCCNTAGVWRKQPRVPPRNFQPHVKESLWKAAGEANARVSLPSESAGLFWNDTCVGRRKWTFDWPFHTEYVFFHQSPR